MRRMHEIYSPDYAGIFYKKEKYMHDPELREAYECGVEHGYEKAREEHGYGERRVYDDRGRVLYRDHYWDEDYDERRRRDSRGRFM